MAAVDPYSPCPCGSGQKFKWCCHKVEAHAERAQRLFDNGQVEQAIAALDEGLRKEPGNAWLLVRRAIYQLRGGQVEEAKESLRRVLAKDPKHVNALTLLTRLVLETEGGVAAVDQLQHALGALGDSQAAVLSALCRFVGVRLNEERRFPSALKHLELSARFAGGKAEDDGDRLIEGSPAVSAWQKNRYTLSPIPEGLGDDQRTRFAEALQWAALGLWSAAAAAFDMISAAPGSPAEADRNLGLCRLWLADHAGAASALRRYLGRVAITEEAVDLEALCQQVAPSERDETVEQVQLIWPLRDRESLLKILRADPMVDEEQPEPIDPNDPESPEVEHFALLDRPLVGDGTALDVTMVPRVLGRVLVGHEIAALETFDDGRLDALSERVTALAGAAIPPAHPKTKVLARVPRHTLALSWEWRLPAEIGDDAARRLTEEKGLHLLRAVWPTTPLPYLGGQTPLQAAESGHAELPLRAAVCQLEMSAETWRDRFDFPALRAQLHIPPEPTPDPETVDVETIHLARLALVPVARLDDRRLLALYRRARRTALIQVLEPAARAVIERPSIFERERIEPMEPYSDLVLLAGERDARDEAFDWLRRGRQADSPARRALNGPFWDMLEVRVRTRLDPPELWVPELAATLERYGSNPQANEVVMMNLLEMGLIRMLPNPDKPSEYMLDPRPLQALMAEYGPRVTTASGRLGVSATKPEIWTPGGPASGGGGGLWTPGSDAGAPPAAGGDKPRLIIPGR